MLFFGWPIKRTAIEYGLSSAGMLVNCINSYKENGYVFWEKTKGKSSTMNKKDQKNTKI